MVKSRKGHHGVVPAIKEDMVKKAGTASQSSASNSQLCELRIDYLIEGG